MSNLKKAFKEADKLISKAEKERNRRGMFENLGYNKEPLLRSKLAMLDISFQDEAKVLTYFNLECDRINEEVSYA